MKPPSILAILLATALNASADDFFEARIRPVLVKHCYDCHSAEAGKSKGGLLLDTREGIRTGGDTGPAVIPGDLEKSLLIQAIRWHDPDTAMPPEKKGGKLPDSVIADFEAWVKAGAEDPRDAKSVAKIYDGMAAKDWWAYQPMTKPQVPQTKNQTWAKTDIDRFILAELEAKGLEPVGRADNATLLRRLYLDLTGLPPAPDASTENLVDRLLDSRAFAERWGRHWLDVARYAETTGGDTNVTLPEAWRFRDYVIESFAQDKPFNEFIREQIAGDLLPAKDDPERAENLIATGFLAIGQKSLNGTDPRQFAVDLADEQIDTVSQAFMATTISCARCHDHKFDPISQRDYTSIAGIFLSTDTRYGTAGGVRERNASTLIDAPENSALKTIARRMDPAEWQQKKNELDRLIEQRDAAMASRRPGARESGGSEMTGFEVVRIITQAKRLQMELDAFNPDGSVKPRIIGTLDKPTVAPPADRSAVRRGGPNASKRADSGFLTIADSPLFIRGSIDTESEKVPRGIPEILAHGKELEIPAGTSGRRELAEWIASPDHTLTARVIVNRVWHWLFGRGLVETVDNFGASGAAPSHPELLDYLAQEFIADGWSIKRLIKRIVTSNVYQLDSFHHEANHLTDPDNRLLWRMNTRRLDAETIRDSMLTASGLLDPKAPAGSIIALAGDGPIGGDRFMALKESQIETANHAHRSIYLPIARTVHAETLAVFDFSDPSFVRGARETTIVPPQALYLMNDDFVQKAAAAMAARVMKVNGFDQRFDLACRLAYGRAPLPEEIAAARKFGGDDLTAWTSICRALFGSAEFLFLN
jgi:Protein of unknown function (DUF1553)/Protein of unknown function (DUF1549)/Planctomycete cytochrome C